MCKKTPFELLVFWVVSWDILYKTTKFVSIIGIVSIINAGFLLFHLPVSGFLYIWQVQAEAVHKRTNHIIEVQDGLLFAIISICR